MVAKIDPDTEERLRQGFKKYLNPFMLTMWRLGMGKWFKLWPKVSGSVLVLTHTGRKTGLKHHQPLNYAIVDGDIFCIAGFGEISDWYRNIRANPSVEVWLPDDWWAGIAEDISDSPARVSLIRQILIGTGIVAYAAGMNPYTMTDEEIDVETKNYRLIRIQRSAQRNGPGGPGDLEWVWHLMTIFLLGFILCRRRR